MSACVSPPQLSVSHIVEHAAIIAHGGIDGVAALLKHHRAGGRRERLAGDRHPVTTVQRRLLRALRKGNRGEEKKGKEKRPASSPPSRAARGLTGRRDHPPTDQPNPEGEDAGIRPPPPHPEEKTLKRGASESFADECLRPQGIIGSHPREPPPQKNGLENFRGEKERHNGRAPRGWWLPLSMAETNTPRP